MSDEFMPSLLNPRCIKKFNAPLFSQTSISTTQWRSLSLKRPLKAISNGEESSETKKSDLPTFLAVTKNQNLVNVPKYNKSASNVTVGYSAVEDLQTINDLSTISFYSFVSNNVRKGEPSQSLIPLSSHTELDEQIDLTTDSDDHPIVSVSFGVSNCQSVDVSTKKSNLTRLVVSSEANGNYMNVNCELVESSQLSILENMVDENMNENLLPSLPKKKAVAVNLEIKKRLPITDLTENSKVLILNTNAVDKLTHVIVQPPYYKLIKRPILSKQKPRHTDNHKNFKRKSICRASYGRSGNTRQKLIDSYFKKSDGFDLPKESQGIVNKLNNNFNYSPECDIDRDVEDMSKNLGIVDTVKCDRSGRLSHNTIGKFSESPSPKSTRVSSSKRDGSSPQRSDLRASCFNSSRVLSPRGRNDSVSTHSPRKNIDSIEFNLPLKSKSPIKTASSFKNVPQYKIVAGTHFAVDAFSYGEIPNVKHYFLTHFHSDHYSGLKKGFNKLLFCSKITADLCIFRLGVNAKCIHIINVDQTLKIEGVEVTAIEANHCPGAIMLVFTLPNGKTMLHTGDFRASPIMESYPIFWNKDIHTIYLDTTYCNPRYDFPTQDDSLEMAMHILCQKKHALEKAGKTFSSVLIVCGTYTIGKEKFFLSMARRVGCEVWACPEKERVLQLVQGRPPDRPTRAPHACQLHVVPMRDLTHEKLKSYLDSLQGTFTEIVAFKPSGWENGKNSSVEKDNVTIHGIPYSEHSSFSEIIRFVKFLKPKQIVPTVDITGGIKSVQKYFSCPLVYKEDSLCQNKLTDYFSIQNRQQVPAVT